MEKSFSVTVEYGSPASKFTTYAMENNISIPRSLSGDLWRTFDNKAQGLCERKRLEEIRDQLLLFNCNERVVFVSLQENIFFITTV